MRTDEAMKITKQDIINFAKGISIGIVNLLPISGGTMVLITGIFERFINSIKSLNIRNFKLLFRSEFKAFAEKTDLHFFLCVLSGIIAGMLIASYSLNIVLEHYSTYTWCFFIGLIFASILIVWKSVEKKNWVAWLFFVIGAVISFAVSIGNNAQPNENFFYLIICGAIGAMGMIVPGISGSHIMIILGNYELLLEAISNLTIKGHMLHSCSLLLPFGIGAILSLVLFSRLLSWLMQNYKSATMALLTGFMLGSIPVLYPWKDCSTNNIDMSYHLPPLCSETFIAIAIAVVGFFTLRYIAKLSKKHSKEPTTK